MHVEVNHPCIKHKMALLRDQATGHKKFRELASEVTMFVCYEALQNLSLKRITVQTPVAEAECEVIGDDIVIVPILRAGVGMLDGILGLVPTARVGFVGLYRDEDTKAPVEYYKKLPEDSADKIYIVVDPMVATGGSAVATLDMLRNMGARNLILICIVTCPEGISEVEQSHPDVPIYAAAIDQGLNERKYIVPGLGDAGDRLFGTL
jgi:uracil phosphoribosyltransferase